MELGYTIHRDVYQEDKKYFNGTSLQISVDALDLLKLEKTHGAKSITCDVSLLMDREIMDDDNNDDILYDMSTKGVLLAPLRKNLQTTVVFGTDYVFDVNIDLDEVRNMNRGNLYLLYVVFIIKLQTSEG